MKSGFKTVSCFVTVAALLGSLVLPGRAAALQQDTVANYICTQLNGYTVEQSISSENYQRMQASLAKQGLSKRHINRQFLKETGFIQENDPAFEPVLNAMQKGDSVKVSTQYIKTTPSGQSVLMSKRSFEQEAAAQMRAPSSDYGSTEEPPSSYNGYVRMAIMYVHKMEGTKHQYGAFGTLEWVIMPFTRMTDAMSFYSNALTWEDKNSNQYNNYTLFETADYIETDSSNYSYSGQEYTETNAQKVEKFPSGFYFSFRFPSNISHMEYMRTYTRFQVTIAGAGELSNNNINTFELFLQYAHKKIGVSTDASFSWSTGQNPGVVFSFSLIPTLGATYYRLTKKVE